MSPDNPKYLKAKSLLNHSHNNRVLPDVVISAKVSEREAASISPLVLSGREGAVSHINSKIIFQPQTDFILDDKFKGSAKYTIDNRVKDMLWNITKCKEGNYRMPHHKTCGAALLDQPIQFTCDNKYCTSELCLERRIKKAWHRLQEFKIKSKRLLHLTLGFEKNFKESKDIKHRREKIIRGIKKEFIKKGIKIYAVSVWDMHITERGNLKRYFMHFHLAMLPVKDYRYFMLVVRTIQQKFLNQATITNFGFKSKKNLFSYFAKIMAGKLSGEVHGQEQHHKLFYSDLMSPAEYMDFFYKKRSLRVFALRKRAALYDTASESEGYVLLMGVSLPEKCSNCGEIMTLKDIELKKFKFPKTPPPDLDINSHISMELYSGS